MGDLISRQALLAEYDRLHVGEPGRARKLIEDAPSVTISNQTDDLKVTNCNDNDLVSRQTILDLPSAQPEIIRCKDCKYWREYKYVNGKPKFLPKCGFNDIYMRENDFCSKGEKR